MSNLLFYVKSATIPPIGGIDAYTKLMLHMDGDQSDSQHVVTYNGTPKNSTVESKFGGGSIYCDGNADYLGSSDSADWDFTADFTIDFWANFSTYKAYQNLLSTTDDGNATNGWWLEFGSARGFHMSENGNPGILTDNVINMTGLSTGTWYHFAIVRIGTALTLYMDGEVAGTGTKSGTISGYSLGLLIGRYSHDSAGTYDFNGYMEEVRFSDSARWTTDFSGSLPSAPYTSDANTKLLLHMNGDVSGGAHVVTSNGNPQLNAATTKFDGAMYFDGSGDYLSILDAPDWDFGTGDWTLDFWFRVPAVQNSTTLTTRRTAAEPCPWYLGLNNIPEIYFYSSSNGATWDVAANLSGGSYSADTWIHMALVRNGNNLNVYNQGTSVQQIDVTGKSFDASSPVYLGQSGGTDFLNGYIDEFRISKGIARWTTDFTPETGPYTE